MTSPNRRLSGPVAKTGSEFSLWKFIAGATLLVILVVTATQCGSRQNQDATGGLVGTTTDNEVAGTTTTTAVSTPAADIEVDYASLMDEAGFGSLSLVVADGIATLRGEVPDEATRQAAESAALSMPDITAVDNQLTIAATSLLEVAAANGNFSFFLAAVDAAGLTETLNGPGPFTVFAPTDRAFLEFADGEIDTQLALLNDSETVATLMANHTVEGSLSASQIASLDGALTLGEATVLFSTIDGVSTVDGALISDPDQTASNGVLHGIAGVLDPQRLVATNPVELQDALSALEPITFETGSAVITAEGEAILAEAAATISAIDSEVLIAGHTDDQGGETANQALSEQRAASVLAYLVGLGVPEELLSSTGFGESEPVADNTTEEGRAQNRRIEFVVEGVN